MSYSFFSSTRIKIFSFCILAFAFILIVRLFFIQIVNSDLYKEKADRQYATPSSDIFERGSIFFETKTGELVSAAIQTTGFKIAINPAKITDIDNTFNKLKGIIDIDYEKFKLKAEKKDDPYEEIANQLSKEKADEVSALNLSGVSIYKEKWRFYPGEDLASHVLGFVGFKGNELSGRYGLEKQYDNTLSQNKDNPYVNFFAEVFSNINDKFFSEEEQNGDIVMTIEPSTQGFLEKKLNEVKNKYNADSVGGIIMNPQDGSIYAMSSKPDFNPNNFSENTNNSIFTNPLVENILEFGSVVKPLVMAAALDAGVVTADTRYNDTGSVVVEKKEIFNFDKKGRGPNTSMQDVLNQSLNTGMVFVYQHLGKEKMRDYFFSYGIKDKTGIDLPNETGSLTGNLNSPRNIEYANASFGQGIALTPVEITRALASLSNGGNLVVPHVVKYIKYDDGTRKEMTYPVTRTKISEKTSEEITRMLVTVMDKSLKGGLAKFEHYSVAVKTGTAQVANLNGGGYYLDKHTHSFFGYFPAYDPKFIVFLYAVNPKGVQYASGTWSDPFLDITKFLINYYQVPPDR
ncbi:MAG TPA: penicillin-binding protein 2 [Candidatus Paceibacterota bacterium]|nr:penicillin-binding protein 2 [Candidatus Paceibacterota bacterium]HPT17824.1 penicillin-binding protein 2 [Candidatus Paceibacterota bacterium]